MYKSHKIFAPHNTRPAFRISRLVFFSLIIFFSAHVVFASDCDGDFCDPGYMTGAVSAQKKSEKIISKPVIITDKNLSQAWDGNHQEYQSPGFVKTVDWRDGVPIWDDSVSHYRDKNYSDFFMNPRSWDEPEFYTAIPIAGESDQDTQNAVADLLSPHRPCNNLWSSDESGGCQSEIINHKSELEEGCPFETAPECAIWKRKPMIRETVAPRAPKLRAENMDAVIALAHSGAQIDANTAVAAPLVARYKMLMQSARACCTDGMAYELKRAGATDGLVYKFLVDDANFYQIGSRCLMMTDAELDKKYPNTATAAVAADVRNGCLCRGRQWFNNMLAPFGTIYDAAPEFAESKFNYTYTDGLQREITVSINNDVQNVRAQLALCP